MGLSLPAAFFHAQKPMAATASTSTVSTIGFLFMAPCYPGDPGLRRGRNFSQRLCARVPELLRNALTGLQLRPLVASVFQGICRVLRPEIALNSTAEIGRASCRERVEVS